MGRRRRWVWILVIVLLALAVVEYAALGWVLPRYAVYAIRHTLGDAVAISGAHLRFPFTLVLTDVRIGQEWPLAGFHAERVVVRPPWIPQGEGTMALGAVTIERPLVRLSRTRQGVLLWPAVPPYLETLPSSDSMDRWRVSVGALRVVDGTVAFLDERTNTPFYGVLDHLSVIAGPVIWPIEEPLTLAIRGELVGHAGHTAPIYCSGWFNPIVRSLETSCQLEPLPVAAFEPYYDQGRLQVRVYDATLAATSLWSARNNELEGRIQLTIANLSEADLSLGGSTLMDIQQLTAGGQPTLTGEVKVAGPLDDITRWRLELVPGNELVQHMIQPLLDRGREMIRLRVGGTTIKVGISPTTEVETSGIEVTEAPSEPPAAPPAESPPSADEVL